MTDRLNCRKNTAILITDRFYRRFFSGVDIDEGIMSIGCVAAYFLDARYYSGYTEILNKNGIVPILYRDTSDLKKFFSERLIDTVYVDYDKTTISEYKKYKSLGVKIRNGADKLALIRSIKSEDEIKLIEKSCSIIQKAVNVVIGNLTVGKTEKQIANEIERLILSFGGEGVSFDTIVAFGAHSAVPHHVPTDEKLTKETVVLIDAGAKYKGYSSDITRTVYFGGSPSTKFIKAYESVLSANERVIALAKGGMDYCEIDALARDYLSESGYGNLFTHSLGHGLGLEIHEYPRVSQSGRGKLKDGTVFTVEPGIYIEGEFGIRIEDTVVCCSGKIQRLFTDSKRLLVI